MAGRGSTEGHLAAIRTEALKHTAQNQTIIGLLRELGHGEDGDEADPGITEGLGEEGRDRVPPNNRDRDDNSVILVEQDSATPAQTGAEHPRAGSALIVDLTRTIAEQTPSSQPASRPRAAAPAPSRAKSRRPRITRVSRSSSTSDDASTDPSAPAPTAPDANSGQDAFPVFADRVLAPLIALSEPDLGEYQLPPVKKLSSHQLRESLEVLRDREDLPETLSRWTDAAKAMLATRDAALGGILQRTGHGSSALASRKRTTSVSTEDDTPSKRSRKAAGAASKKGEAGAPTTPRLRDRVTGTAPAPSATGSSRSGIQTRGSKKKA